MKNKYLFLILSLIIFTLFAGCNRSTSEREHGRTELRHPRKGDRKDFHRFDHSRVDKMAKKLDLSAEQVEALKEMEKEIMEKLNAFYKGKTVVIVAHRLSTVRTADTIFVLDKGEIVEVGSHSHLTKIKGKYYALVKDQLELGN